MLIAYWLIFMFTCSFFYCDFKSPISEEMAKQGRGKRQRGNDYLYLMEEHQKKNEKEQSEANFYSGSVSFCSQLITNVKDLLTTNVIPL